MQLRSKTPVVLALFLIAGLGWWLVSQLFYTSDNDWDKHGRNLPDRLDLQTRINHKLFGEDPPATQGMGADIDSSIQQDAMAAKLAGLTRNVTTLRDPSDAELREFYETNREKYRYMSSFGFRQILFSNMRHGAETQEMAQDALQRLNNGDTEVEGDPSDLPESVANMPSLQIDRLFGNGFSDRLLNLTLDKPALPCWLPVKSGAGIHLVCIEYARIGEIPPLEKIRTQVEIDWRYAVARASAE